MHSVNAKIKVLKIEYAIVNLFNYKFEEKIHELRYFSRFINTSSVDHQNSSNSSSKLITYYCV